MSAEKPESLQAPSNETLAFCEILNDRATVAECRYFTEIWSALKSGSGGIVFPERMLRGERRTVSLVVSRGAPATTEALLGERPSESFQLKVARRMAAELKGEGFEVDPAGLQLRDLNIGEGARWDWQVTAVKSPRHNLTLSAYAVVLSPDGSRNDSLIRSLKRDIPVDVGWRQKYADFVVGVVGLSDLTKTLVAALGALLAALVLFRSQVIEFARSMLGKSSN